MFLSYLCHARVKQSVITDKRTGPTLLLMGELFHIRTREAIEDAVVIQSAKGVMLAFLSGEEVAVAAGATYDEIKALFVATYAQSNVKISGLVSVFAMSLIAYAKRGNATEHLLGRVTDSIREDTQKNVVLDINTIKMFYNMYANELTEHTAEDFFEGLEAMLPHGCQALVNLVTQTAYTGVTAAVTIKEALITHPNFNWDLIADLFPTEMTTAGQAVAELTENKYIGFKSNLGDIASTKYKNVAWVAKELMIRISGKGSLKAYGGWIRIPAHQARLETLIETYVAARAEEEVQENAPARDAVRAIINAANQQD